MEKTANDTLRFFTDTVQKLSLARDMQTVMAIVRTAARQLTGADGATFVLKENEHCFYADEDAISPLWKGNRFPLNICISGWTMQNKKPAVIEDIYADDRIPHDAYRPTFVKSLAMVPIRTMEPIGAIGNYWADRRMPTADEVSMLQSLADITAVTIENVNVYQQLEQRVRERTAQLEAVNKELETFSYSVSHDLRAPLRAIMGYADILHEDNFDKVNDEGKAALTTIRSNGRKMNTLIDELLQFSKLSKECLQTRRINTDQLVERVITQVCQSQARPQFHVEHLQPCTADETLIEQVWTNLISNAVKYSSKKENPEITISSEYDAEYCIYHVKDNGAGFDMTYSDKLFGAFQRLHSASEFPGNGIGLALANRIVVRHGGKLWALGEVGKGATFSFCLPRSSS